MLFLIPLILPRSAYAAEELNDLLDLPKPVTLQIQEFHQSVTAKPVSAVDVRVKKVEKFLTRYNSPLTPYAAVFVASADKYGIDWRLVPAIAGVESTFGKHIPPRSYNAYGWNGGKYRFQSWEHSIDYVSRALGEKYYARGLNTPSKIGRVYAPPSTTWSGNVTKFINQLEKTTIEEETAQAEPSVDNRVLLAQYLSGVTNSGT